MKLVHWNVQWCRGVDGRVDPERIVEEALAFGRAADGGEVDVICLQEVAAGFTTLEGSRGENQFAMIAGLLPGHTPIAGVAVDIAAPDGTRRIFGNLILSRLPVRHVRRIALPWPNDPSVSSMPRLLLDATLDAPSGPLRVMTTHLEYAAVAQRRAQVEAIRAHHAEACGHALHDRPHADDGEGPFEKQRHAVSTILTGDFNFQPTADEHARLQADFEDAGVPPFVDAWQALRGEAPQPPTLGVFQPERWPVPYACDFVFASRDLLPRLRDIAVESRTRASDHQPMRLVLDD